MELLTGKSKEDFYKWHYKNVFMVYERCPKYVLNSIVIEWLDSVGIICLIGYNSLIKKYYWNIDKLVYGTNPVKTRGEATFGAIKEANEIYNKKHD